MSTAIQNNTATQQGTETFVVDAVHSEIGFSVRHLMARTRGRFASFTGEVQLDREHPENSTVAFEVEAASIDTRNADRDAHLRSGEFFDVANHPVVRFVSHRISKVNDQKFLVEGALQLRGILKPMTLEVEYQGIAKDPWGHERAGFSTQVVVNRKEFGMIWNAALETGGVLLGDDVTLTIDLETVRKS